MEQNEAYGGSAEVRIENGVSPQGHKFDAVDIFRQHDVTQCNNMQTL